MAAVDIAVCAELRRQNTFRGQDIQRNEVYLRRFTDWDHLLHFVGHFRAVYDRLPVSDCGPRIWHVVGRGDDHFVAVSAQIEGGISESGRHDGAGGGSGEATV